jgi:ribosome-binding protein aMBF1 (putative translation factor)
MGLELKSEGTQNLGDVIRHYRLRQRQIHTGAPWAQEDLAVAIGSDKSHVNRIPGRSAEAYP